MSFIKKAVKKVFSAVKKVVKSKIFKWVAIAAIIFFTAGVAAGGFAAFAGVNSVGTFFVAVGQTMATGAASMAAAVGLQGTSASLAAHGGAAAIQAGLTTTATSATGAALTANALGGTITATGGTNAAAVAGGTLQTGSLSGGAASSSIGLSSAGTAAVNAEALAIGTAQGGALTSAQVATVSQTQMGVAGQTIVQTGASSGISSTVWKGIQVGGAAYLAAKSRERDKLGPTYVAGGISKGGSANPGPQPFFTVGGKDYRRPSEMAQLDKAPLAPATQEATLAGTLARQEVQAGSVPAETRTRQGILAADGPAQLPDPIKQSDSFVQSDDPLAPVGEQGVLGTGGTVESLADLRATSILSPRKARPLEDRIFGGSISGVS
jgi:hypothetical protein